MEVPIRNMRRILAYPPEDEFIEAPARNNPPVRPTLDTLYKAGLSNTDIVDIFYDRIDAFATVVLSEYIKGPHSEMHLYLYKLFRDKVNTGAREVVVAPRGCAKCLDENTLVQLSNGRLVTIKDIELGSSVLSMTQSFKIINSDRVVGKYYSGRKLVRTIRTISNKEITITDDHRLYTLHGYVEGKNISIGTKLATPRKLTCTGSRSMGLEEAVFWANVLAEGCLSRGRTYMNTTYTNFDKVISDDFILSCSVLGFTVVPIKSNETVLTGQYRINGCRPYLRSFGVTGCLSKDKSIPDLLFEQDDDFLKLFLGRFIDTDGWVSSSVPRVGITLASKKMVDQLATIFLRLGFVPSINYRPNDKAGAWCVSISGFEQCFKFYKTIPLLLKGSKLLETLSSHKGLVPNPNRDTIDKSWRTYLKNVTPHFLRKLHGLRIDNGYHSSRSKVKEVSILDKNKFLYDLATSDIYWDEVVEISEYFETDTYDIEVSGNHNFIANNIVSHNSTSVTLALPLWCICNETKHFIFILSDTQDQAEDFLSWIKEELETNMVIKELYPRSFGKGSSWRNDRLVTNNDILIRALGSGGKIRGRRYKNYRPDLILCHEKGTLIEDPHTKEWLKVEDASYPKKEITSRGLKVRIHGLPFGEVVTYNHKYYTKKIKHKINQWDTTEEFPPDFVETCTMDKTYYIGYPIDDTVLSVGEISIKKMRGLGVRGEKGRWSKLSKGGESYYTKEVPAMFHDPEFWWFVGLWWGDGTASKTGMNITIADKDIHVFNRLTSFLSKYGKRWYISRNADQACYAVAISLQDIRRWFLSEWKLDGNSHKRPPLWVERIDIKYQKELIKGYLDADGFIDYQKSEVRLTSVCYEGLLSVRRILARIGIPSSIRKGIGSRQVSIFGRLCNCQQKYDLRFREGANLLGIEGILPSTRYSHGRVHISDGVLWSKIKSIEPVGDRVFVPLTIVPEHYYNTDFGRSHQCDDLENKQMIDSDTLRRGLVTWFDQDVCKAGARSQDVDIFVAGTILHRESLLNQLYESPRYSNWHTVRFQAIQSWCSNSEGLKQWEEWKRILINRYDPLREEEAKRYFLRNKDTMLEGTSILWKNWDTYYSLMYELVVDGEVAFFKEKQNIPQSPEEQIFRSLVYYTEEEFKALTGTFSYSLYLDSSLGKQTKKHDYSAITILAKHNATGISFVRACKVNRVPVSKQVDDIVMMVLMLNNLSVYPRIGIESNAFQTILGDEVKKKLQSVGARYEKLIKIHHAVEKASRIESLEPAIKTGTLRFRDREDQELVNQLLWYPQGKDDAVDSLEGAYSMLNQKVFVPSYAFSKSSDYSVTDTYAKRFKKSKFLYD